MVREYAGLEGWARKPNPKQKLGLLALVWYDQTYFVPFKTAQFWRIYKPQLVMRFILITCAKQNWGILTSDLEAVYLLTYICIFVGCETYTYCIVR